MTTGGYDNWPETLMRRGWDSLSYLAAIRNGDEDMITNYNPLNWTSEREMERDAVQIMSECDLYIAELSEHLQPTQADPDQLALRLHAIMPEEDLT